MNENLDTLFAKARQFQYESQLPQAIQCYQQILEENPEHLSALNYIALAYAQLGDMEEAIRYLKRALKQDPDQASLHNNIANAYRNINDLRTAIQHYQQAIQLAPDYAQAHNNLAAIYDLQGNFHQALRHYKQAVHAEPDFTAAHFNLGLLLLKKHELRAAKTQFRNVLTLNPEHLDARFLSGVLYLEDEQLSEAEKAFKQVLDMNQEHVEAITNLGVIALKRNKAQEAIHYFTQALALNNEHIEARNNLASTFMHHDRFENALMHYDELLKKEPDNIEYHYNSGVAQMALGHLNEAIEHFEHILSLNDAHFAALNNLAAIYIRLDDKEKARSLLKRAVQANPKDAASRHMLQALLGEAVNASYSPEYANHLFNNYALYYDQHMQSRLNYAVPQQIGKVLHQLNVLSVNNVLDLGCGTGLSGVVLREISQLLTGVDISAKMLAQAKEKQIYDQLIEAELIQFLKKDKQYYDLIVAADVLPYFGELQTLFTLIHQRLEQEGLFIFTTEISADKPWQLQTSARFSHQAEYIESLCNSLNFSVESRQVITARLQEKADLKVYLYVIRKL